MTKPDQVTYEVIYAVNRLYSKIGKGVPLRQAKREVVELIEAERFSHLWSLKTVAVASRLI